MILLKDKIRYALIFTGIAFIGLGGMTIVSTGKEKEITTRYGLQQRAVTEVMRNSPNAIGLAFLAAGMLSFAIVYCIRDRNTFKRR